MTTHVFFGNLFHRCTRKHLDSVASSILFNAAILTTDEQWSKFINMVNAADGTLEQRCASLHLFGESALNLLKIGLEMLTPEEYRDLERWSLIPVENLCLRCTSCNNKAEIEYEESFISHTDPANPLTTIKTCEKCETRTKHRLDAL